MKRFFLALLLSVACAPAWGAIVHDGVATGGGDTQTSPISWNHTVTSNTKGILVVGCAIDSTLNRSVTAVSYNTVALTNIRSDDNTTNTQYATLWFLLLPTTGTHSVSVTTPGTVDGIHCYSESMTGVDQVTPLDGNSTGAGTTATTGTTATISITTNTANAAILDIVSWNSGSEAITMSAVTNRVQRLNVQDATDGYNSGGSTIITKATAGSQAMSWTRTTNNGFSISAATFRADTGAAGAVCTIAATGAGPC